MNRSKAAVTVNRIIGIVQVVVGLLVAILFGICVIVEICAYKEGEMAVLIIFIILTAAGVRLFLAGRKRGKFIKIFKDYVSILSNDPTNSIENIAASTGSSVDVVIKNINMMIKKKYFTNASIDRNNMCLVLPGKSGNSVPVSTSVAQQNASISTPVQQEKQVGMVTVICKSCGGVNTVPKGQVCECDYCGSYIQG